MIQFSDIARFITFEDDDQEQKGSWHWMNGYLCFEGGYLVQGKRLPEGVAGWFLGKQPKMSQTVARVLMGAAGRSLKVDRVVVLVAWYEGELDASQ